MNPHPYSQLDRAIHEKGRLAIVSALAATDAIAFTELRDLLGMTDGNLTTHIKTLQQAGYVAVTKCYRQNRPRTTCSLTPEGIQAFQRYLKFLEQIIAENKRP